MARTRWPVGPGKPRPLVQAGQIRPAPLVGAVKTWDPADRSSRRTARTASADSEVRPGPRLPTLRPYSVKIGEAGPEALPTLSLPTLYLSTEAGAIASGLPDRQLCHSANRSLRRATNSSTDSPGRPVIFSTVSVTR